mmetsp:Transcript_21305/g.39518  ORF Transcript_21305/g.39518 Transcript_21305/m.39518 type:complete len:213 (+) Transcript_21305:286-924(+)
MLAANCSGVSFFEFCRVGSAPHRRSARMVSASFFSTAAWRGYLCFIQDDFFEFTVLKPLFFRNHSTLRLATSVAARPSCSRSFACLLSSLQRSTCSAASKMSSASRSCCSRMRSSRNFSNCSTSPLDESRVSPRICSRMRSSGNFFGEFSPLDASRVGPRSTRSLTGSAVRDGRRARWGVQKSNLVVLQKPGMVAGEEDKAYKTKFFAVALS